MKKYIAVCTVCIFCTIVLSGLNIASAQNKPKEEAQSSRKSAFSIETPDGWIMTEKENTSGEDPKGERYSLISGPKDESGRKSNITIIIGPFNSGTPENYVQNLLANYAKKFQNFTLDSKEEMIINGVSFASFIIKHKIGEIDYTTKTVFTIRNDVVYQLNAIAPVERFRSDERVIDEIIRSFRIIEMKN